MHTEQLKGGADTLLGKAQHALGELTDDRPLTTVAIVAGAGMLLGLLLRRR